MSQSNVNGQMTAPSNPTIEVAGADDIADLAVLAREVLPFFPALHDEGGWHHYLRFGDGSEVHGNCTLTLRSAGAERSLVGFVWADDALRTDYGVLEPWWCINALAIAESHRRLGLGLRLTSAVETAARRAGVTLLYGEAERTATGFWDRAGYLVAAESEGLRSTLPVRVADNTLRNFGMSTSDGSQFFVKSLMLGTSSIAVDLVPESLIRSHR